MVHCLSNSYPSVFLSRLSSFSQIYGREKGRVSESCVERTGRSPQKCDSGHFRKVRPAFLAALRERNRQTEKKVDWD